MIAPLACQSMLGGAALDGDGLAQAVQQAFQMGHALAQFGELLLQSRQALLKGTGLSRPFSVKLGRLKLLGY